MIKPGTSARNVFLWTWFALFLSLAQAQAQENQVTTEDLFDMLVPSNTIQKEEEVFPPLKFAEHYTVSWSAVMSFSDFDSASDTASEGALARFFLDYKSRFFRLQLACPTASRLVLGLVDERGQRQRSKTSHTYQDTVDGDAMACGPPIDLSRNVLKCRGIPSGRVEEGHFSFQASIEVTCLAYVNSTSSNINTYRSAKQQKLGLTLAVPQQSSIRTQGNVVLTESFYAKRINNLEAYLEAPYDASVLDGSDFECEHSPEAAKSTTCSKDPKTTTMATPGLCSRQLTCYYSSSSPAGKSCTSSLPPLVLTSLPKERRLDPRADQSKSGKEVGLQGHSHQLRRLGKKKRFQLQTRYRILWSAVNFGCESYSAMIDITCSSATSVSYQGFSFIHSNNSAPSPIQIRQQSEHEAETYWSGSGPETHADKTVLLSSVECFPSLFGEITIHCQRYVPASSHYQEALAIDVICTQEVERVEDALPNLVTANILKSTNIQCATESESANNYHEGSIAQVGSALTVVPVTMNDEDVIATRSTDENDFIDKDLSNNYVLFPPPEMESKFDPTSSIQCSSCVDSYDFYVNYDNNIGNKVSQIVKGCQTMAACHDAAGGCVGTISQMTVSYLDPDKSLYLSYISPTSSQSKGSQWHLALWMSLLSTMTLWVGR